MSWIKIEIQKDKQNDTSRNQVEQIDYGKSREIAREVVREELNAQNQMSITPLTKEDIQEAVCNAIVQVNDISKSPIQEKEKVGFWKAIWMIIRGKGSDNSGFTTGLIATVLAVGFNVLFLLGLFIFVAAIVAMIQLGINMTWECARLYNNIMTLVFMALICVLIFFLAIMFKGAANDIQKEKDRNYIVSLFSGITSFVALVVSIIALYRGGCGC